MEALVANAEKAAADGFTAIKFDVFPWASPERDTHTCAVQVVVDRFAAAVRDAESWDDLNVELHREVGPGEAVVIASDSDRFGCTSLRIRLCASEDGLGEIAKPISIPLAVGEWS
jgi:hypothetical protein